MCVCVCVCVCVCAHACVYDSVLFLYKPYDRHVVVTTDDDSVLSASLTGGGLLPCIWVLVCVLRCQLAVHIP